MKALRLAVFALLLPAPLLADSQPVPNVVREETASPFMSGTGVTLAALLLFALIFGGSHSADETDE